MINRPWFLLLFPYGLFYTGCLCGNRLRFTFRCKLRVPEDTAAAWGVTPDAAGEGELTRSCVLVRDAVGFWHPAAVENV